MSCPASFPLKETFFISHGSPTLSIDESLPARHFLKGFRDKFMNHQKPNSILVISAHWETSEPTVNSIHGRHDTIHDFYGFPKSMYQVGSFNPFYFDNNCSYFEYKRISSSSIVWFDSPPCNFPFPLLPPNCCVVIPSRFSIPLKKLLWRIYC